MRYRSATAPIWASYCHCATCRKVSGAPYTGFVEFSNSDIDWQGEDARRYESSPGVIRRFCANCGSALTFEADGVLFVTLGSLDQPDLITVKAHTYMSSRLPEVSLDDSLLRFPGPVGGKGGRPVD